MLFMKTLSYIQLQRTPSPPPTHIHKQFYFAGFKPQGRVGRANVRCSLGCGGETAHLTMNPKYKEERGKSQAGGPEDTVVARPVTGGKRRGSCCCVRSR